MNKTSKLTAVSVACILGLMVSACSTPGKTDTGSSTGNRSNQTASTSINNSTNSNTTNTTSNSTASSTGNSSGSGTNVSGSSGPSGSATSPTSAKQLVSQSMQLAKQGKVAGVTFSIRQNIGDVQKAWGHPKSESFAGAGIYDSFPTQALDYGFNKGGEIFDVRSYSPSIQSITRDDVESVLGKPASVRTTSDSTIWLYPVGADYQVLWVFPKDPIATTHVKHISVFYPEGTIDMMAQNVPNPSLVVNEAPGTVGSLFTFSILNAPKGYYLAELIWIPTSGEVVATTGDEAATYGATGGADPHFELSGDRTTWSFIYNANMVGETGKVKLVYQNTSGMAIVGMSPTIDLK